MDGLRERISHLNSQQVAVLKVKTEVSAVEEVLSFLTSATATSTDAIKTFQAALLIEEVEYLIDFDALADPIFEAGKVLTEKTADDLPSLMVLHMKEKADIQSKMRRISQKLQDLREKYGGDRSLVDAWDSDLTR